LKTKTDERERNKGQSEKEEEESIKTNKAYLIYLPSRKIHKQQQ